MWIAGAGGGRRSRLHPFILFLVDDDKQANLISTLILLVFYAVSFLGRALSQLRGVAGIDNAAAALLVLRKVEVLVVGFWCCCSEPGGRAGGLAVCARGRRRTGARGSGWGARRD
jgi:hypothetical protein